MSSWNQELYFYFVKVHQCFWRPLKTSAPSALLWWEAGILDVRWRVLFKGQHKSCRDSLENERSRHQRSWQHKHLPCGVPIVPLPPPPTLTHTHTPTHTCTHLHAHTTNHAPSPFACSRTKELLLDTWRKF